MIIASNSGGRKESVVDGECGFLCESGRAIELATKMHLLLNASPSKIKAMGLTGMKRMQLKFSTTELEKQLDHTLEQICRLPVGKPKMSKIAYVVALALLTLLFMTLPLFYCLYIVF